MDESNCKSSTTDTQIIYDGACPLCNAYVKHTAFNVTGELNYVDARQCPELVSRLSRQGIELDDGLVVHINSQTYHGADAMHILSTITSQRGLWNRFIAGLFASPESSRILYPVLRTGRNLLLRLLGRPPISSHVNNASTITKKTLYWTPIVLLLLLAGNHVYLRNDSNLSPWLGAGFGMFSTTDSVSARQLVIYGIDNNGFSRELMLPDSLYEAAKRARGLPSTAMLTGFANRLHDYFLQSDCYAQNSCVFTQYRIEIWRARYDSQTLLPEGDRLASHIVTVQEREHEQS